MATSSVTLVNVMLGQKYRLMKLIGCGSFGQIYLGICVTTGEEVAIKLEDKTIEHPQLVFEFKVYEVLSGVSGIPRVITRGEHVNHNYMVLELLGPSLENLFNFCDRQFSLKTVLMLAHQMISRIEYVHGRGFLHRDIKPENFLMGLNRHCNTVYLIDYGLSKKYKDKATRKHIPFKKGKRLTGTARYASINNHNGYEPSRRDDLESIGYMLIYFLKGSLPWQGFREPKKKKYEKIRMKKMTTPVIKLCKNCPPELATYLNYCRSLDFDQQPNYRYLKDLFKRAFLTNQFQCDWIFDWTARKDKVT